jgi:L-alanine-DL-glutamate epimerase-like enolase superfamily enzyme
MTVDTGDFHKLSGLNRSFLCQSKELTANIASGLRLILPGENPLEHERLWQKMYRRTMYFGRTAVGITAMAANG